MAIFIDVYSVSVADTNTMVICRRPVPNPFLSSRLSHHTRTGALLAPTEVINSPDYVSALNEYFRKLDREYAFKPKALTIQSEICAGALNFALKKSENCEELLTVLDRKH